MNLLAHWKNWIRPMSVIIYFIALFIAIPLCVIELTRKEPPRHVKAFFIGGIFTLLAVPISLWEIIQHLIHYTQPHLQRYIIRILWMVPIYAMNAWLALRFPDAAIYLDTLRECYEAYVIYNFMAYLLSYLNTAYPDFAAHLEEKPHKKFAFPLCCLPPWKVGSKFIMNCKHGVLQYTVVRPVTTIISLICELSGKENYGDGDFNFKSAWSYLVIVNNISQVWATYCLVLFYKTTKEELRPVKPMPKFLCVKFVVFFSFWQSVLIAILAKLKAIPQGGPFDFYKDISEIANGIQDFCICIEMFLAAVIHYFAFSHKPFIDPDADQAECFKSFASMWNVSDVRDDVVEHVKVIGTTVKKTVTAPLKARFKGNQTEKTPLLQETTNTSGRTFTPSSENVITADVHNDPQLDTRSLSADLDSNSIDCVTTYQCRSASMHNYFDGSSSIDTLVSELEEDHGQRHSGKKRLFEDQGLDRGSISEENFAQSPTKLNFNLPDELEDHSNKEVKPNENLHNAEVNVAQSVKSSRNGDEQAETYHQSLNKDVIC
ncbi:hypothetical protein ACJMK2_030720 [Sinanodonta woodiana]|uniref:Transmembrane protein 184C n=1 Tax=Sinanodonta woodiana TaxID=1069815 RepID=A0ABD3WWL3_SINWO